MAKESEIGSEATSTDTTAPTDQSATNQTRTLLYIVAVCSYANVDNPQNLVSGTSGYATFKPPSAYAVVQLGTTVVPPATTGQLVVRGGPATLTISTSSSSSGSWTQVYSGTVNSAGGVWIYFTLPVGTKYIKIETSGSYNLYID